MLKELLYFIEHHRLIEPGSTVVVGLSGGPDSVCLLHLLHTVRDQYRLTLVAAHIDHEWRASSGEDARFCEAFAQSLGIPFTQIQASQSPVKRPLGSREDFGRRIRRAFFEEVARHYQAQSIALAHHAGDQQETFFLRMIRGATISGLASIRPRKELYIRPLLWATKDTILNYLKKEQLSYRVDATNEHDTYLRNALRMHVLPALIACDSRFEKNFGTTLSHIQETDLFLERLTAAAFARITSLHNEELTLHISLFFAEDPFLHHRLLLTWLCREKVPFSPSTALFEEIIRFFRTGKGSTHQLTPHWFLVKKREQVSLKKGSLIRNI